jgi:PAS domain S-box-containing protein
MSADPYRILIIDDNPDDRAEVRRLLLVGSDRRYKFTEAENGKSGIAACLNPARDGPDCVVLDYHLPDMNAVEVLCALAGPDGAPICPVVVLTGGSGVESGREVLRAGAQDYIGKGWITPPALTRAIENATERWNMVRELREREKALRQSERRFRGIFDTSFQYIALLSPDGTVLEANRTALESAGVHAAEVLGRPLWDTVWWQHDCELQARLKEAIRRAAAGEIVRFEASHLHRTDVPVAIDFSITPIRGEDGEVVLLVPEGRDVTEWKRSEEMLKSADRRKDEFLATLAHELRNPLSPIRSGLEVLRMTHDPDSIKQTQEMMGRQLGQMVRLIEDLMDVSRISSGKLKLRCERLSLQVVAAGAIEAVRPLIEAGRHLLHLELPHEPVWVDADSTRLAQVMSNILTNAAKYTPDGGKINFSIRQVEHEAVIVVSDTGLGIPREMLSRVFEMFAQVNRTLDRAQGGLGIGLALVKQLIEMHGGKIEVSSAGEGLGSVFTIRMPVVASDVPASATTTLDGSLRKHTSRRILVVDDNIDGANTLAMMLRLQGHVTRTAHCGEEVLAVVQSFSPDVVLLDIGLPGMSGYEVANQLKEVSGSASVALIAVTGWGSEEDRRRSKLAGFDYHLTKPVEANELTVILTQLESTCGWGSATPPKGKPSPDNPGNGRRHAECRSPKIDSTSETPCQVTRT